jgi:glycosyltransferase involved in cell wall biosynthesis
VLIESSRHLPVDSRVHFVLVGSGMSSAAIKSLVAESRLAANFHLIDYRDNVLELVASCDATVLPATRGEGLPKTVIESMALGVTPIVTGTGGSPELVIDGECGLVVPPGDAPALAAAIQRLEQNPDENAAMARRARQRLKTHFNAGQGIEALKKLYESLTSR